MVTQISQSKNIISKSELFSQININMYVCIYFKVATDVIREFAADGVKYLELRSTPREEKDTSKICWPEVKYLDFLHCSTN